MGGYEREESRALIKRALKEFAPEDSLAELRDNDLGVNQSIDDYKSRENQKRYTHMYTAKHIALWSSLRDITQWDDRLDKKLYSIGAGPLLDLIGWCYYRPWNGRKLAIDPLDWSAVIRNQAWEAAHKALCGNIYIKPLIVPCIRGPQLVGIDSIKCLAADKLAEQSIILMPHVINHIIGNWKSRERALNKLIEWINTATREKNCRVAIVDRANDYSDLWSSLTNALEMPPLEDPLPTWSFLNKCRRLRNLFGNREIADYRTGARYPQLCTVRALLYDGLAGDSSSRHMPPPTSTTDAKRTQTYEQIPARDADLRLYKYFIRRSETTKLFQRLDREIEWRHDKIRFFGKEHELPRLQQWFADNDFAYTWSGIKMQPAPWVPALTEIRLRLKNLTGIDFNTALANKYRDGQDTVSWHSDDEPELGENPLIASVSLGTTRPFVLKHKFLKNNKITIPLTDGSLLLMGGTTQSHWQHSLPRRKRISKARINLTFRLVNVASVTRENGKASA